MQQYLFQVSIGPVQDFIAAARRTRDLKFGSELLSELSKAAAKAIAANPESKLIFPAPANAESLEPNSDFNVANKIVALISGSPKDIVGDDKKDLAEVVYMAIQARLDKFRAEAKGFHELPASERKIVEAQLRDLVEYFWVALPYSGDYNAIREKVEALMAARKNSRNFSPVTWGSQQDKSSIDGKLESVIPKDLYPHSWQNSIVQHSKADILFKSFHAKPGEHLSGVDLLKRNGPLKGDSFPSTSHFATIPFLQRLETLDEKAKDTVKKAWSAYIQELGNVADRLEEMPKGSAQHSIIGKYEGSMLFEERFSDLVDFREDLPKCEPAKEKLRDFFKQIDKQFPNASPKVHPGTYYAFLLADGDSMGKAIDHEAEKGPDRHQELSQKLATFSESVRSIVEHHGGWLIYAGGDDVLAFMPLHTVLQCAQTLANEFKNQLKGFTSKEGTSPTLSVGIAVIHHLQPLREALKLARDAEKSAKHVEGKDALAITMSKRSGSDLTIRGQWEGFYSNVEKLLGFCREDAIPEGTAFELRDLSLRLTEQTGGADAATLQEIIKAEAKRILNRQLSFWRSNQTRADNKEALERMHQEIVNILSDFAKSERIADEAPSEQFANTLIAAQFFADARDLAGLMKEVQK